MRRSREVHSNGNGDSWPTVPQDTLENETPSPKRRRIATETENLVQQQNSPSMCSWESPWSTTSGVSLENEPPSRKRPRTFEMDNSVTSMLERNIDNGSQQPQLSLHPSQQSYNDTSSDDDVEMLPEEERARQASMMQLVMGTRERNLDAVDLKLERLIRQSRFQAMRQTNEIVDKDVLDNGPSTSLDASLDTLRSESVAQDGGTEIKRSESAMDVD